MPTMFDQRTRASRESLERLRREHHERLWPDVIPVDTRFRDASRTGALLTVTDADTHGALAYRRLLADLEGRARTSAPIDPVTGLVAGHHESRDGVEPGHFASALRM